MHTVESIFKPIIGQYAWGARQGYGAFLTIEFGPPHLMVREPLPNALTPQLRRRRVHPVGNWQLWVMHSSWSIKTPDLNVNYLDWEDKMHVDQVLSSIDGNMIIEVHCDLKRDLTILHLENDIEIQLGMDLNAEDDQWRVYEFSGRIFCYTKTNDIEVKNGQ